MQPIHPGGHFTLWEFRCRFDNAPYPADWQADPTRLPALLASCEDVRAEIVMIDPTAVLILSEAYRTEAYQRRLIAADAAREKAGLRPIYRAALHSQHPQGRAVDAPCPRGLTFQDFADCVKRAASKPKSLIRYIELRPAHHYIHWDVRPTQKLIVETIS